MLHLGLTEIKRHLRIEHDDEDDILRDAYIPAAIDWVFDYIGQDPEILLAEELDAEGEDQTILTESGDTIMLEDEGLSRACKMAVLLCIGALYANRGNLDDMPGASKALMAPYRNAIFAGA